MSGSTPLLNGRPRIGDDFLAESGDNAGEETTDEDNNVFVADEDPAVVAIDMDVDETTRLFTVSDEEDGLVRYTSKSFSDLRNSNKAKGYPKELKKTIVALLFLCTSFVLTTTSLSVIHEWMPEYQPLPDAILDSITYQSWALKASEITIQVQVAATLIIIILHKHRTIVIRRISLVLSLLYGYRAVTMFVTVLPKSNPNYFCSPKLGSNLTFTDVTMRVIRLISGFGLTMNGHQTYCGDFIFSGHTMILVLSALVVNDYTSRRLWILRWGTVFTTILGIIFLLLGRGHYSIDVILAYWITTRLWFMIHSVSCHEQLKNATSINHMARLWWWPVLRWFECNVKPGPLPHGFNLPVPLWVWACLRKLRYKTSRPSSTAGASGSNDVGTSRRNSSRGNGSKRRLKEVP